jgi:hypothetical protein
LGVSDFAKYHVHIGDHGNALGSMLVLNFVKVSVNWDLNTFQEFEEMKGITHKRKKTARNILSRRTWQFFRINAVVFMICMARVKNQHPPVHHEGWMISG